MIKNRCENLWRGAIYRGSIILNFEKHTYTDLVVSYVKECILNGTYKPGDKVKELIIAKKLTISRAPVREALQVLIQEGLIVWKPQKGKFITELDSEQIRNSYFSGGILEGAAVAQAIDLYTDRDLRHLEAIVEKMRDIAENNKPLDTIAKLDDEFHAILFSRIHNELLKEFCRRACQGLSKFLLFKYWIQLFTSTEVYLRHKEIVEALKKRDAEKVEKVVRKHYFDAGERMSIVKKETETKVV